jgi:UDP-N-acetyl-D-glucosamine dehydrogenase
MVLQSQEMLPAVAAADCVVIVTDHTGLDYAAVIEQSKVIVDTRNALKGFRSTKIVRL